MFILLSMNNTTNCTQFHRPLGRIHQSDVDLANAARALGFNPKPRRPVPDTSDVVVHSQPLPRAQPSEDCVVLGPHVRTCSKCGKSLPGKFGPCWDCCGYSDTAADLKDFG